MAGRPVVVVEVNEIPRRVVADVAAAGRAPFLAARLANDELVETVVAESLPREMYPSQTWASFNTGVPWSEHGIWWYGDPKPERYPMYWQTAAAAGLSVGLVGSLHSSPLSQQCRHGNFRFVIPDSFAPDADTIPSSFSSFQELNLRLTKANSRQTSLAKSANDLLAAAKAGFGLKLSPVTLARLARLVGEITVGRVPKERLRTGQFLVLSDLFARLLDDHRPDLAVLFTNHVAAAMHRYWYASYPDDFAETHYSDEWVERHRDEIPAAVETLDRFLQRLHQWCESNNRTLLVVSSMGQGPSADLASDINHHAVVVNPTTFLGAVGIGRDAAGAAAPSHDPIWNGDRILTDVDMPTVRGSMAPTLTLDCQTVADGERIARHLQMLGEGREHWHVDQAAEVVTLNYDIEVVAGDQVKVNGAVVPADRLGLEVYEVDDHSSGRHIPHGVVAVANSTSYKQPFDGEVDYLDFAPSVLRLLGLQPLEHHRVSELQL